MFGLLPFLLLAASQPAANVSVLVETEFGVIEVELDAARAPRTAQNFLRYVDAGAYTGGQFHRTVKPDNQPKDQIKIEVIQAGSRTGKDAVEFPPIKLETTLETGLRHLDGTISMARGGTDTATSSFFICIGAQVELDFGGRRNPDEQGFAAFGQVVSGMDVVRRIQQAPAEGQSLLPAVRILRIYRKPG